MFAAQLPETAAHLCEDEVTEHILEQSDERPDPSAAAPVLRMRARDRFPAGRNLVAGPAHWKVERVHTGGPGQGWA
ncbi:hypothetical protein [Streptomyces sp. NPDC020983]|uniref:hypothetical protein n=1 Tax=Streptomyces sp. NPDC020983 TaxID=3365106 RepID=UPI00379A59A4